MATAPEDLYPFSTQDGKNIPLDIIRPLSSLIFNFVAETGTGISIPATYDLVWIFANRNCMLAFEDGEVFDDGVTAGTEYESSMFVPADMPIVVKLPNAGTVSIYGLDADDGFLAITSVQRWAGLLQPNQANYG